MTISPTDEEKKRLTKELHRIEERIQRGNDFELSEMNELYEARRRLRKLLEEVNAPTKEKLKVGKHKSWQKKLLEP